jgi:hypothetical protein
MKKAILINVEAQTVTETTIGHYSEIYKAIGKGCSTFECPVQLENDDTVYVDECGLYHDPKGCFILNGWNYPLVGNAIILGSDDEGESVDCQSTVEEVKARVKFYGEAVAKAWAEKVLSTPPQIIAY